MPNASSIAAGALTLALAGPLVACAGSGGGLLVSPKGDGSIMVTAKACEGLTSSSAPLVVKEGESVMLDTNLSEGGIRVRLSTDEGQSPGDPADAVAVASGEPSDSVVMDELFGGDGEKAYSLAPGSYSVTFIVPEGTRADGSVAVSVLR